MAPVLEDTLVALHEGLQDQGNDLVLALRDEILLVEVGVNLVDLGQRFGHVGLRHGSTPHVLHSVRHHPGGSDDEVFALVIASFHIVES